MWAFGLATPVWIMHGQQSGLHAPASGSEGTGQPTGAATPAAGNHITVISGSLAPESALIKLSGKTMKTFEGPAQVYDGEQKAFEAIIR